MNRATISWNGKQLARMYENGCLRFDNAVQRGEVWSNKPKSNSKSKFIDSLIRDFPVPPIYAIKTNETVKTPKGEVSVYDCLDGKQRLTTLASFKKDEFELVGLDPIEYKGEDYDLNGKKFSELPEEFRDEIDSFTFSVCFFTNITHEEELEIMDRLNNGKPLTGIEKARIKAKDLETIMELGTHDLFGDYLSEKAILSYQNEDIVIKTYIETYGFNGIEPFAFDNKSVHTVYVGHKFTDEEKQTLTSLFEKAREVVAFAESIAPKKVFNKIIRKTNLLAVIYYVYKSNDLRADDIAERIVAFFSTDDNALSNDADYNEASSNATMRAANVKIRNDSITQFCDGIDVP